MPRINGQSATTDVSNTGPDTGPNTGPEARHYDLVIIGAGIAGLSAGRRAMAAGKSVLILDKGRRIGGRVATRRADGFVFNHGAQFLTARDPGFQTLCTAAIDEGSLTGWQLNGRDALIGAPFMRAFPAFLGTGLEIRQECEITAITASGDSITFASDSGIVATATAVIVSAPAPQTAKLIASAAPELIATATAATYAPCWTALLGFDTAPAGISENSYQAAPGDEGIIAWAGWEHHRPDSAPIAGHYALTIQASPVWSHAHIDQDRPDNLARLKDAYEDMFGIALGTPRYAAAHRWLYAKVLSPAPPEMRRLSHCGRIAIAGDWLGGARIEHAYLSGQRAVQSLYG